MAADPKEKQLNLLAKEMSQILFDNKEYLYERCGIRITDVSVRRFCINENIEVDISETGINVTVYNNCI